MTIVRWNPATPVNHCNLLYIVYLNSVKEIIVFTNLGLYFTIRETPQNHRSHGPDSLINDLCNYCDYN